MTVYVTGVFLLDGAVIEVCGEGGSGKEAWAEATAAAEELGCSAPIGIDRKPIAVGAAAASTDAGKRTRRTKAEMEADKAREAVANVPPPLPLSPPAPATAAGAPVSSVFGAPGAAPGPVIELAPNPPAPHAPPGVTISPPAPAAPVAPVASPRDLALADLNQEITALFGSIPPTWTDSVSTQVNAMRMRHGGDVNGMTEEQIKAYHAEVKKYRVVCDAAPR